MADNKKDSKEESKENSGIKGIKIPATPTKQQYSHDSDEKDKKK